MKRRVIKCSRCHRRLRERSSDMNRWNVQYEDGYVIGYVCPDCQTDMENLEAQVNEAILDYKRGGILPDGRAWAPFKGGAAR